MSSAQKSTIHGQKTSVLFGDLTKSQNMSGQVLLDPEMSLEIIIKSSLGDVTNNKAISHHIFKITHWRR